MPSAAPRRSSTAPGATWRWPSRSASASRWPSSTRSTAWPRPTSACACASSPASAWCGRPIARAWSGASSSRCSTGCSAITRISTTPWRCARVACRPTSRSPSSSCRPGPGSPTPKCSAATPASTTRRWPSTSSASAPTSSASWWRRTRKAQPRISLSSNTDVTLDMLPYIVARRTAGQPLALAVEINANLPYMPGAAEMDAGECDVVLETERPHYELFAPPKEPVSLPDYAMALHAATLIKDGGTLQIGIGSFSDALAHALILRHTRNGDFRALLGKLGARLPADAELAPFTTGLYGCTEMLVDGFLALMRAGILRRRVATADGREAILHAGFFVGNQAFYRELREMPPEAARADRHDRHLFHQHPLRRSGGQARAADACPLRQHRHGGNPARRRVLRSARGRPRRQRRRRPARPRRHGARAGGCPLHHRRARHPAIQPAHGLQHRLALRQRHVAAAAARHPRHRVRHRRPARQVRPRRRGRHARGGRQRLPARAARGGPPRRQGRAHVRATRPDQQPGGEDRGRPCAGPARRPAACVPARHRDDRGRADAGRPAHVPEVGRLR